MQVETGVELQSFPHRGPVRGVAWSDGSHMFATISDPFMDNDALISIYASPRETPPDSYSTSPILEIELPRENAVKATNVAWGNLNKALFVTFDDGSIRLYDPKTGDISDTGEAA